MSILNHPVIKGLGVLVVVVTLLTSCIGLYLFFVHLRQGQEAKKVLDERWLRLDIEGHKAIEDHCKATQVEVKILAAWLKGNRSNLYQRGLRDGMAVCRSQQE